MTDYIKRLAVIVFFAAVPFISTTKVLAAVVADSTDVVNDDSKARVFKAHVESADNGEALPYVSIFVKSGVGTMTNEDGDFTIKAMPEDVLQLSYVGFQPVKIKAKDLPKKVKMKSLTLAIENVTVIPSITIFKNVQKRLEKEYGKNNKYSSRYFLRQVTSSKHKELVEAFLEANNAINLRNITFLSGYHGHQAGNVIARPFIANMNFQHPLEIGMLLNDSQYWGNLVTPFFLPQTIDITYSRIRISFSDIKNISIGSFYDYSHETFYDDEGHKFYRLIFNKKSNVNRAILTGALFVDGETYEVLNFDGAVEGLAIDVVKDYVHKQAPIDLKMKINYRSVRGYTEVDNLSYTLSSGNLSNKALIVNIDSVEVNSKGKVVNKKRKAKKPKYGGDKNMLEDLSSEGFAEVMAEHADFVKRTTEESDLAMGKIISVDDEFTNTYCVGGNDSTAVWKLQLPDTPMGNKVNRLAKLGQLIPQEKVYVQMDNTCYFLGDTIWYSTFLRRTSDDLPSTISGILYVELYNQDGYLMERQMIDMYNGRGTGYFVTSDDWYGGYYELRAYTRWQLNWGVYTREHSKESENWFINEEMEKRYFRDYDKLYSRVFPVYDPPKEKGKYSEIMTTRALRRYFRKDPDKRELLLNLYPEGGEMIAGVPCRVAFEAVYSDGEYASGTLSVRTKDIVDQNSVDNSDSTPKGKAKKSVKKEQPKYTVLAKTENRGRGVFTFVPSADKAKQEFIFTSDYNQTKATAQIKGIENDGVALSVMRNDSLWNIHVQKVGKDMPDSIGLTVMHDGRVRIYQEIYAADSTFCVPDSILEAGVNQVTVFDNEGRVFADRLFFVSRPGMVNDNLMINGMKEQYEPYEKISLGIHSANMGKKQANTYVSLSVRDTEHADFLHDNGTIRTEMLLSSELKGFIPNPGWFFEKDDAEHRSALDLLMMTQGWRRFNWRDYAIRGAWDLTQPDERTPVIVGSIYKYPTNYFYNLNEWASYAEDVTPEGEQVPRIEQSAELDKAIFDDDYMSYVSVDAVTGKLAKSANGKEDDGYLYKDEGLSFTDYSKIPDSYQPGKYAIAPTVMVNSELTDAVTNKSSRLLLTNDKGRFRITLPRFYNTSIFHLAAADTAKFKKGDSATKHIWVQSMLNQDADFKTRRKYDYPEYSVRVDYHYPRFVKPYNFYQQRTDLSLGKSFGEKKLSDGSYQLAEVKVGAKHSGMRARSDSLPAIVVDGYEAYNFAIDAGMRHAAPTDILRAYVGDYGVKQPYWPIPVVYYDATGGRHFRTIKDYNLHVIQGATTFDREFSGNSQDPDSMYRRRNLESHTRTGLMPPGYSTRLENIDAYAIYTDYQPRLIGSRRYSGDNLPRGEIAVYPIPDSGRRRFYRDRCWILDPISQPREFYSPDYSKMTLSDPPADYRRTLYWNPFVKLDENGSAVVHFYNNGNLNQITVKVEGLSETGDLLQVQK